MARSVGANARVALGVVVGDVEGGSGGAVVPDQKLEAWVSLGEDAFDCFG